MPPMMKKKIIKYCSVGVVISAVCLFLSFGTISPCGIAKKIFLRQFFNDDLLKDNPFAELGKAMGMGIINSEFDSMSPPRCVYSAVKMALGSDEINTKKSSYSGSDSSLVEAKSGIENSEEKQAYIDKIELYDFTAKYEDSILDGRVPGVEFKIKNKGDRTLSKVEVTVYFKSADDTVIAEESYDPVFVSDQSFGDDNKPLKPNYIWQQERGHFYAAKNVPTEWKEGAASAKVTDIEFSDIQSQKLISPTSVVVGNVNVKPSKPVETPPKSITASESTAKRQENSQSDLHSLKPSPLVAQATPEPSSNAAKLSPMAAMSQQMSSDELDALRQQLSECWRLMAGARYAADLVVDIHMIINPDRNVTSADIVDTSRYSADSYFRAAADSAKRAIYNPHCTPLDLPPDKYETWKDITVTFDPKDML